MLAIPYALTDQILVKVDKSGLHTKAVDPSHVAMVELDISKKAMEAYRVPVEGVFGIDLDKMADFLKVARKDDLIEIWIDIDRNRLCLEIDNLTRRMAMADPMGIPWPKIPNIDHPNHIQIDPSEIAKAIKIVSTIDDHIVFRGDRDLFSMEGENDVDGMGKKMPRDLLPDYDVREDFQAKYPLDYLIKMIKKSVDLLKISGGKNAKALPVSIDITTDYPIKISGEKDYVTFTYLLAPRLDSDEEEREERVPEPMDPRDQALQNAFGVLNNLEKALIDLERWDKISEIMEHAPDPEGYMDERLHALQEAIDSLCGIPLLEGLATKLWALDELPPEPDTPEEEEVEIETEETTDAPTEEVPIETEDKDIPEYQRIQNKITALADTIEYNQIKQTAIDMGITPCGDATNILWQIYADGDLEAIEA